MSNHYIPKENLTAYERWEVAAFDEAERMAKAMREAGAPEPASESTPAEPAAPPPVAEPAITEEELAALREQAFAEGRAAGFEDGFKSGQADGYANGESLVKAETRRLATLASAYAVAIETAETRLADELLSLAIDLAGQVLRTSLRLRPELMVPAVREAIAALANVHGHPNLLVNPADADLLHGQLGEQLAHTGWRILEDPRIVRGGCRIENGGAEIDATLDTRWRRVIEVLGHDDSWLDRP